MKKFLFVVALIATFTFTACNFSKTETTNADSTVVVVDSLKLQSVDTVSAVLPAVKK